jgi:hypothetical protein
VRPHTLLERIVAARIAYTGSYLDRPFHFSRANLDRLTTDEPGVAVTDDVLDRAVGAFLATLREDGDVVER